jgi:uncharacterized membrane protein
MIADNAYSEMKKLAKQRFGTKSVFLSHRKHNKASSQYFFASTYSKKMTYIMNIGKLAILLSKLKNLLSLINQRAVQLYKALRAQPYLALLFVAIVIYGAVFSYFTVLKHNVFQSYAWDLGIFNQALYTTIHNGKLFYYTVELFLNPSGSYFAVHFSPILFLLLPLYAINSSPITLLIIQSFALSLGAIPLYLLAKKLLRSDKVGFMLAIVYLLYPAIQGANWIDFHPTALLPLLFFSLCYFMVTKRWKLYFPCVILTLMIEENVFFVVLIIAAYYFLTSGNLKSLFKLNKPLRMNEKLASAITLIVCIIYYAFSVYTKNYFPISPKYAEFFKATWAYSVLGVQGDPKLFSFYVLSNPQNAFNALMYDYSLKFLYIIFLFGPLLFIPFKSKLTIGIIGLLSLFLFSNYNAYYLIGSQYALFVVPLIFTATIYGLRKFDFRFRYSILKTMLLVTLLFTVSISPISPISDSLKKEGLLWQSAINLTPNENTVSLDDLVNAIPSNASVLTQNTIFPHLSSRINAYVIPFSNVVNDTEYLKSLINGSEYVLLGLSLPDSNTQFVFNEITRNNSYGAYALASNAILFKRGFQGEPLFTHFTEYRVFSAYKDLDIAPFSRVIDDSSEVNEKVVLCPANLSGYFMFGPYTYLLPGSYEVTFMVKIGARTSSHVGWVDISSNLGNSTVSKRDVFGFEMQPNKWTNFTLSFTSTKLMTFVEFRAFSYGTADMYIDKVIVKRISSNVTSDFGLKTFSSDELSLISGYVSKEGFLLFQQNTISNGFWYGPYVSLPPGKYRATVLLKVSPSPQEPLEHILTLSVSANSGRDVYAKYEVRASDFLNRDQASDWQEFTLEFITRDNLEGVEFTGLAPSSNFNISLAYILVEKIVLSPDLNYELFNLQRGLHVDAGQIVNDAFSHSGEVALSQKGLDEGILTYGPYITLNSGTYTAVFRIKTYETSQDATILFEVISQPGTAILSKMTLNSSGIHDGSWFEVSLPFSLEALTPSIEFRVSNNGMTNLYIDTVTVLFP